jgi:hypothetical protein
MSSLPLFDIKNEPKIASSVEKFFKDYKVMELLRRCGLRKSEGIPLWSILSYIFSNVFRDRSMYMQQKSGKCTSGFSKNTYYRFMQNPHINWLRFTILLAERIVNGHLKDLTSDQRADCFVFDDSLYSRTGYKKTELAAKDGAQIDARIVCVRNRSNRKDWIALICMDMTIDENEIIRIYGKRWDIEVFFKACKSFLKLGTEYHGLSYDALTAHTAFVFLRYMFMSVEKRDDEDDRTIGELFYCMVDELADITFNHSLQILVEAMFESVKEIFQPTEDQMGRFTNAFISRLPKYMQEAISPSLAA